MAATSVSARFQELFPETNLISLLTKYGGDADDIFEAIQDRKRRRGGRWRSRRR